MDRGTKLKPYYQDEWVQIYKQDYWLAPDEILGSNRLITDPPYNFGVKYDSYNDKLKARDYQLLIKRFITRANLIAGGNVVLVLGSKILREWWNYIPQAKLIIVRMGAISNNRIKGLTLQYHPILTTVPSNTYMSDLWEDIRWPGEGYYFNEQRYGHPAMTPEKLARRLVSIFSEEGQIILDPFGGVGTIAVAAKLLNRHCKTFEISEKYCEIAAKRCSQGVFDLR